MLRRLLVALIASGCGALIVFGGLTAAYLQAKADDPPDEPTEAEALAYVERTWADVQAHLTTPVPWERGPTAQGSAECSYLFGEIQNHGTRTVTWRAAVADAGHVAAEVRRALQEEGFRDEGSFDDDLSQFLYDWRVQTQGTQVAVTAETACIVVSLPPEYEAVEDLPGKDQLRKLVKDGVDLNQPIPVRHFVRFEGGVPGEAEAAARAAAADVAAQGWSVQVTRPTGSPVWGVDARRTAPLTVQEVLSADAYFKDVAKRYGGRYVGRLHDL